MSSSSETNRSNARKSTGPKTEEGKHRSSQNAIKHGLFAKDVMITGEDSDEFRDHKSAMIRRLNPRDVLELHLAEQIVADTWTIKRVRAAEQKLYVDADRYGPDLSATLRGERPEGKGLKSPGERLARLLDFDRFERLNSYQRRLASSFHRCLKELRELRKEKDDPTEPLTDMARGIVCELVNEDEDVIAQNEPIPVATDGVATTCDQAPLHQSTHNKIPCNDPTNDEPQIEGDNDPPVVPRAA